MKFISILIVTSMIISQQKAHFKSSLNAPRSKKETLISTNYIHANNVKALVTNSGLLFNRGSWRPEFISPSPVFSENEKEGGIGIAGLWLVGKVNGEARQSMAFYRSDFSPGDWTEYQSDTLTYNYENPKYTIYYYYSENQIDYINNLKIEAEERNNQKLMDYVIEELEKIQYSKIFWPDAIRQGAPEIPPGDVATFSIFHDSDVKERNGSNFFRNNGTAPLNVQIRELSYAYRTDDAVNNTIFTRYEIINKNDVPIEDMMVSYYMESDLGETHSDDGIGSDKNLKMMYNYSRQDDTYYNEILGYESIASGVKMVSGPVIDSVGHNIVKRNGLSITNINNDFSTNDDVIIPNKYVTDAKSMMAIYDFEDILNYYDLSDYFNGYSWSYSPPSRTHYAYHIQDALDNGLTSIDDILFNYHGDPVFNFGWLEKYHDYGNGHLTSHEFTLGVSNGNEDYSDPGFNTVTFASFMSYSDVPKKAVGQLRQDVNEIISFYKCGHKNEINNLPPIYRYYTVDDATIQLHWEPQEPKADSAHTEHPSIGKYKFEGYQVVQFLDESKTEYTEITVFDINNDIRQINNLEYNSAVGEFLPVNIFASRNKGIRYSFTIDSNYVDKKGLKNNNSYYFGIRAIYYNPMPSDHISFGKFGDWAIGPEAVVPTIINIGYDTLSSVYEQYIEIDYAHGSLSDGKAFVSIADPYRLTGSTYNVKFKPYDSDTFHPGYYNDSILDTIKSGTLGWFLEKNGHQISNLMPQTRLAEHNYNIYQEGLRILVTGPQHTFKDFRVTANANGTLDDHAGFAADYNGWPGLGRHNISNQQANGAMWLFGPWHSYQAQLFSNAKTTLDGVGNLKNYAQHDFEWRFTGNGKAFNYWTAPYNVIDIPFEIWDIGSSEGPEDDVKLIPYLREENGDNVWNYGASDNPISGSSNDPEMERIYWMAPKDYSPGTSGFDSFMANVSSDPNLAYDFDGSQNIISGSSLIWWNGWDVNAGHPNDNLSIVGPEIGTILKFVMTKPNTEETVFSFNTPASPERNNQKLTQMQFSKHLTVFPNPFYGKRSNYGLYVTFANLPKLENDESVSVKIYTTNGEQVRNLRYKGERTFLRWYLDNDSGNRVNSNLYIAVIKFRNETRIIKVLIFL